MTYDEETEEWNICRTSTIFYQIIKLRSVDFKFKLDQEFDEVTPDKRDVRSIVTVEGDTFKHVSKAKKEGVTLLRLLKISTLKDFEKCLCFKIHERGAIFFVSCNS